jgi:hypothetical protein
VAFFVRVIAGPGGTDDVGNGPALTAGEDVIGHGPRGTAPLAQGQGPL